MKPDIKSLRTMAALNAPEKRASWILVDPDGRVAVGTPERLIDELAKAVGPEWVIGRVSPDDGAA